jgi:DNA modification methylase
MEINKLYNENCLDTMAKMPDNFIDLTVTSPPYDGLRNYNGYSFPFEDIAKELYKATKQGGIVVWVVGDETKDFCETLTSFKQAIFFTGCGFKLLDTMIYAKKSYAPAYPTMMRYAQTFEYMFIFSKGKPKTFNPIQANKQKSSISDRMEKNGFRQKDGTIEYKRIKTDSLLKDECNVWVYDTGFGKSSVDEISYQHPAIFPEQLAQDHIISWSNPNDLIYDPFTGSGTTAKMAVKLGRNWIGSEISAEYCEIANKRISDTIKLTGTTEPDKAIPGQQINLF